jgi:hypothetical protein
MASASFSFGTASDRLTEICCPGIKAISLTGRELRRAAQREARKEAKRASKVERGIAHFSASDAI